MKQARNETLYYASEVELRRKSSKIEVGNLKLLLNLRVLGCPIVSITIQVSEGADSLVNIRVNKLGKNMSKASAFLPASWLTKESQQHSILSVLVLEKVLEALEPF